MGDGAPPHPESGRVGEGVNSASRSAEHGNTRNKGVTPTRLASLAGLPLFGGGEEASKSNAIALPASGRDELNQLFGRLVDSLWSGGVS